jgi:hypothetical protein
MIVRSSRPHIPVTLPLLGTALPGRVTVISWGSGSVTLTLIGHADSDTPTGGELSVAAMLHDTVRGQQAYRCLIT